MIWTALCAALLVSGGWLAAYWIGRHDSWSAGQGSDQQKSLADNAAASSANTASGKMAKRLDDLGTCNITGFVIQREEKGIRWNRRAVPRVVSTLTRSFFFLSNSEDQLPSA